MGRLIRGKSTPQVASFATETLELIESTVLEAILKDKAADQKLLESGWSLMLSANDRLTKGHSEIDALQARRDGHSNDHKECRVDESELCAAHDQCRAEQKVVCDAAAD